MKLKRVAHQVGNRCLNLAVSADSRWIAWVDDRSAIRLWDIVRSEPRRAARAEDESRLARFGL